MAEKKSGLGGARPGAGRPALPGHKQKHRICVSLHPSVISKARKFGDKNTSEGVRRCIEYTAKAFKESGTTIVEFFADVDGSDD